jgi:hypothetical protein
MMATTRQRKTAPELRCYPMLQVRQVEVSDKLTELHGRAVPYNEGANIGWYVEDVAPGAFAKSIMESARALPLLLWHDNRSWPVGRAVEWDEQPDGLYGHWGLDGSDMAQRAGQLAADGFLTGLSVGFVPVQSDWTYAEDWNPDLGADHMDRVTRTEARLVETSLTPTPAFAGAGVTLVRSAERPKGHPARSTGGERELAAWQDYLASVK